MAFLNTGDERFAGPMGLRAKAALKRTHSKRSAHVEAADGARQRLECVRFSAAFSCGWFGQSVLVFLLLFSGLGTATVHAQSATAIEYKVKAAFILNFARFVEWPESAFPTPTSDLVIGVLGRDDPFGVILDETIRGKTVDRRGLPTPKRSPELKELLDCQVLFVCRSEEKNLKRILDQLRGKPVLTISEIPGFNEQGGIIEFKKRTDTVRFGINAAAARDGGLKISSKLLKLSD